MFFGNQHRSKLNVCTHARVAAETSAETKGIPTITKL